MGAIVHLPPGCVVPGRASSRLTCVLVIAVAACIGDPPQPLRVGLLIWPPYDLFVLARDLGYYDERIELVDARSPAEAMRAYRSGTVDAIAVTLHYALETAQSDSTQRVVLVIDESRGADAIVARPPIATVADLRGRRLGVEASTLGVYVMQRALERAGLPDDAVEVVPVDVADHVEAYDSGRVDAVVTYEPARTQLLNGGAVELFSSRQLPGEIVDVLLITEPVGDARPEAIRQLVEGWLRARDYLLEHPDSALARLASRGGLTPVALSQAFEGVALVDRATNHRILSGEDTVVIGAWQEQAAFMLDRGLLQRAVDPADLLWPEFVRPQP